MPAADNGADAKTPTAAINHHRQRHFGGAHLDTAPIAQASRLQVAAASRGQVQPAGRGGPANPPPGRLRYHSGQSQDALPPARNRSPRRRRIVKQAAAWEVVATLTPTQMTKTARFSYWFIAITILVVGWLHLAMPLLSALFSYLLLSKLRFAGDRKWVPVLIFAVLVFGIGYGLQRFARQTVHALPEILEKTVPTVITWAEQQQIDLPFTDYESLKAMAMDAAKETKNVSSMANAARIATTQFVFLIIGCVVAVSIFLNAQMVLDRASHRVKNNLYAACADDIGQRFRGFYHSFVTVMGAQIIISGINTALTSAFVLAMSLPHAVVIIGVTFFCGLLPVIGNLISNTVIVAISFTISPKVALAALVFLVVIHKLEYFLNSKIIGDRIKNPIWLTLLGLILGEKLMGIPGMILAPVVLNYLKVETSKIEVGSPPKEDSSPPNRVVV
jgi:predicted PurR-regulated permease PerM